MWPKKDYYKLLQIIHYIIGYFVVVCIFYSFYEIVKLKFL